MKMQALLGQAQVPGVVWIVAVAVVALLAVVVVLWVQLRRWRRAVEGLRVEAMRFARGDLSQAVSTDGPAGVAELAETLNQVAEQLRDRLTTVVRQRNEIGAVVSSMAEGVLAIDVNQHLLSFNGAAADLLRLDPKRDTGRLIQETVRNAALQDFAQRTLAGSTPQKTEVRLRHDDRVRNVEVQSAVLTDAGGERLGVVFVLHDVTTLRRLESVRQDFVANVSHEVRTPVSAIKAAIETLMEDESMPMEHARRFMGIVRRQSDRLDAIVNDLLSLARLEVSDQADPVPLDPGPVSPILRGAVESCTALAKASNIHLQCECEAGLRAMVNPTMLEQAVVNLIDNAIKYSPDDTTVRIEARRAPTTATRPPRDAGAGDDGEVRVSVTDEGRGIEPEHLSRIFERFYRTDKSRSRLLGGTGLGLSIVKHVAEAHRGRVTVNSTPGQGTTFCLYLQATPPRSRPRPNSTPAKPVAATPNSLTP